MEMGPRSLDNRKYPYVALKESSVGIRKKWVRGFPTGLVVKNLPANAEDMDSFPGLKRLPGEGNGNLFQYSCLGNSMDRRAWCATVHEPLHGSKPCHGKRVSVTQ